MKEKKFTMKLIEASISDIELVGGKNASLGEMMQNISQFGIDIPDGFIITSKAYYQFIADNQLDKMIRDILEDKDLSNLQVLLSCGSKIRKLIQNGRFSAVMQNEILEAYKDLLIQYADNAADVAVRSSATAEDLPDASFAGQQDTYLNISGEASLLTAIKNCFASLFTDRAISYRESFNYDHFNVGLSVCVQKMVRSDKGVSGVAFSLDTESGFKDAVIINGSYGLGEMLVQGSVNPDEFIVYKPLLKSGFRPILEKKLGKKHKKMIYGNPGEAAVTIIDTPVDESSRFCLSDDQIIQLSNWVMIIEAYYTKLKGKWCPMDIEWAVDGITGRLFIVQARPETIHSRKQVNLLTEFRINDPHRADRILLKGIAVGDKIATGKVHNLTGIGKQNIHEINFLPGDIMVTDMTDPDWEPVMKKASAIITNKGGRTCHAAIVARELGVPAIVGCECATAILKTGDEITASCAEGDAGIIYSGIVAFTKREHDLNDLPEIETPLMMNIGSPEIAFNYAHYPGKGVGLAREEFIINNYIKIHPLALLEHRNLNDASLTAHIEEAMLGYESEEAYFIEKLSYGIAKIAAAFYPNKVIVRFSDFKTNEYYNMPGGKYFEPNEENPMIGWRGASRYYSKVYKDAFGMECKAIKKVREMMGLDNVVVMIPFCRTVNELSLVYETMNEYGLKRGENGLEVYLMAEVPSNVILAEQFANHVDGFSIGSNDLTQLVLGLDRDSSLVAGLYNERNDAVKFMISSLIKTAKKRGVKVGICGQGPSDYPDFAQFLVEEGIDSISVTPDSFFKTVIAIKKIEDEIEEAKRLCLSA
ncbi:phosphoenolpyruvate synthase [Mucilaginibacter gossypii]|uniref:phosphoenolpyruvate synthase n=1 Tax=Mucilaginibacter gossypii TaxID=551996 RepID=UPI000DCB4DC6|nr:MULTISPECIES: phosphoenolpyruvate synthase [Mucilaginibacter]QTE40024.1 phosphoenolpyruvate synthase [Mucilaginibacter gossypii]RAV50879.1 phosphoenolpyruvate synthase [Mucilaginibacter rubeus]